MYIAFKWLVGLSFTMWLIICITDVYLKRNKQYVNTVFEEVKPSESIFKNVTLPVKRNFKHIKENMQFDSVSFIHGAMFLTGALAVSVYNRKTEIITYTKIKLSELNVPAIGKSTFRCVYCNAILVSVATVKHMKHIFGIIIKYLKMKITFFKSKFMKINQNIHCDLITKLKDLIEERRNLGKLLITAIHENKSLRTLYQLETMAKCRLTRHMEDTHKQIYENRSRYISFQQLYLVTHQENAFLKARVGKLIKEKDEAEKNLLLLMNEVYKSRNTELRAFCSRFIVKTKKNLLDSDVKKEINKFLQNNCENNTSAVNWQLSQNNEVLMNETIGWAKSTMVSETDSSHVVSDAPKLKGLPGEYVWTVKNRDGIIEKLYEYDYDSGDIIRRIRQYSVYYDKDCLLDFSNSKTVFQDNIPTRHRNRLLKNQRFLTGSEAFQQFLKCNENIVTSSNFDSLTTARLFYK